MRKATFPLSEVYRLLEPGPVVMVTTVGPKRPNIMTMSWHLMIEFDPPLFGCVISNRNYSFELLEATGECGLNIPTVELAEKVVGCGNCSGRTVDKFTTFALTPEPATAIQPPLIGECYANLECKVFDRSLVDAYGLFIFEVVQAWHDPEQDPPRTLHHRGQGTFMVAGDTLHLPSAMK